MAGGTSLAQFFPDVGQRFQRLVGVGGADHDALGTLQHAEPLNHGQTAPLRRLVHQDEHTVMLAGFDSLLERLLKILGDDNFLRVHS